MNDDEKPMTTRRAFRAPEFWLLVVAGMVSMYGVRAAIVIPLVVVGLSLASLPKHLSLWSRARAVGAEWEWLITVAVSFVISLTTACAIVVFAAINRWFWGVRGKQIRKWRRKHADQRGTQQTSSITSTGIEVGPTRTQDRDCERP